MSKKNMCKKKIGVISSGLRDAPDSVFFRVTWN